MTKAEAGGGLGIMLPAAEYMPVLPEDFDFSVHRNSASRLITLVAGYADLPGRPTSEDYERVSPLNIQKGLIVGTGEAIELARVHNVQSVYQGVGFDSIHYPSISRSPNDLAGKTVSKFKEQNKKRSPDKKLSTEEAEETAHRAAGHALESLVESQEKVINDITTELTCLRGFRDAIDAGPQRRYRGKSLDRLDTMRKVAETVILSDLEIAFLNRTWAKEKDVALGSLIDAVRFNLYAQRGKMTYWKQYLGMAGKHALSQIAAVQIGIRRTKLELVHFEPYLERGRQRNQEEQLRFQLENA